MSLKEKPFQNLDRLEPEEVAERIYRLPLPVPFEVGPVNCYLCLRGEPLLVDTGPKTDEAYRGLREHLGRLGLCVGDLRHVVISHAHVDHHGNLGRIASAAGSDLEIWCHELDLTDVFDYQDALTASTDRVRDLMRFWGFPEDALAGVERFRQTFARYGDSVDRTHARAIEGEGGPIAFGDLELRAIHTPGHSRGLVTLLLEEGPGYLFASDHILETITPNPAVYQHGDGPGGFQPGLADYVRSLERLKDVPADRVLPGHGAAFSGLRARIDAILVHHERRTEEIAEKLAREPRTVFSFVPLLWPGLPPGEFYLACREVHGHLDLLVAAGRASVRIGAAGSGLYETAS